MISDDDLFCLFEKAFDVPTRNLDVKVAFVKEILRRYKAMEEPVCVRASVWLFDVSLL